MALRADAELDRVVREEDFDGAFFLHGEDERLRDDAARRLVEAAVEEGTRDFNLDRFRGDDVDPAELSSALSTPPMMAERRVVVLFGAEELTPTGRGVVEDTVADPPPGLTFVVTARIPDGSSASLYSTLKEHARSFGWTAPREQEIPGWLMERAEEEYGYGLSRAAARALASAVGDDLSLLDAELEKLGGAADGGELGEDAVRELVPNVRPVDRWDWLDRVAGREYGSALEDLPTLLQEPSESAVGLLIGMIEQHLYIGLALEGGRREVSDALVAAGKPYLKWKARIYDRQSKRWSRGQLRRAVSLMRRADRHAKSGIGDRAVLQELLGELRTLKRQGSK